MHFNGIDDFCLWGPPEYGKSVGDIEGIMVAWCTKPGHGTRLIPKGALTGVQWIKAPGYVQVVGFFDQTMINVLEGDYGGEMDPHGADLRGNPMGGIVFTNQFGGSEPQQAPQWHNFLGGGIFCFKACDLRDPANYRLCENRLDRMGCKWNAPNAAEEGIFEECLGENQDIPGVYTLANGEVTSYVQPWEGDFTVPYEPRIPASSECTFHTSSVLYTGLPEPPATGTSTTARVTGSKTTGGKSADPSETADDDEDSGAKTMVSSSVLIFVSLLHALFFI